MALSDPQLKGIAFTSRCEKRLTSEGFSFTSQATFQLTEHFQDFVIFHVISKDVLRFVLFLKLI
jgi:hypothetical protein